MVPRFVWDTRHNFLIAGFILLKKRMGLIFVFQKHLTSFGSPASLEETSGYLKPTVFYFIYFFIDRNTSSELMSKPSKMIKILCQGHLDFETVRSTLLSALSFPFDECSHLSLLVSSS